MLGSNARHFEKKLTDNPRIAEVMSTYTMCRSLSFATFEKAVDTKHSQHVFVRWPTGWAQLPVDGGIDDQPCWTMDIMQKMLEGEREGVLKSATRKRV